MLPLPTGAVSRCPALRRGGGCLYGLPWLLEVVLVNGSVAGLAHLRYKTKVVFPWGKQPPGDGGRTAGGRRCGPCGRGAQWREGGGDEMFHEGMVTGASALARGARVRVGYPRLGSLGLLRCLVPFGLHFLIVPFLAKQSRGAGLGCVGVWTGRCARGRSRAPLLLWLRCGLRCSWG